MELSKTAYVILGMLKLGKRTGYEIKSLVDVSVRFFWAASYGQIYPELKRLEEAGLIKGREQPHGERRRTEYELTRAGEEELERWLASPDPPTFELRDEAKLRFFFSDSLPPEAKREQLRRARRHHERVRDQLRAMEPDVRAAREATGLRHPHLTLRWGIAYHEFMLQALEQLEEEAC